MRQVVWVLTTVMMSVWPMLAVSAADVDTSEIAVSAKRVFAEVEIKRPIVVTHAGDGSNRLFVASQLGKLYVLPKGDDADEATLFLDQQPKVTYKDNENEEGLLGFAFHPKYKENGQFFLYYITTDAPHTSVVSRFTVSKTDPNKADPASEQELLRIPQPYWNHKGGTICFGPDGYLYIGLGDGGSKNDPHGNGQNLGALLGKILRIDVDHHDAGKKYAVPKDNPFVGKAGAQPEIYASGIRNVWRMSFDRETGALWIADVGQDLWEEINLGVKGGNYGWSVRESMHKFGPNGSDAKPELIDPIWEYPHDVKNATVGGQWGKSITGGNVYRGKSLPQLRGYYVYADYVTGGVWGLKYDAAKKAVVENRSISTTKLPVMSFGEDESGEQYFTTPIGAIFKLVAKP